MGRAISVTPNVARAMRVRHWAHFLLLPLASVGGAEPRTVATSLPRGVAIAFCVLAFGYLLNGVSDCGMDGSADKNALVGSARTHSSVHAILFALAAAALLLAFASPWPVTIATSICLASGVAYSIGPRLKRFPIVGTLLNVSNFAPLLWVGLATAEPAPGLWPLTAAFVGLLLQNQLLHEAADREEDARGRVITTVRAFGDRAAGGLAALLGTIVVLSASARFEGALFALAFVALFPLLLVFRGSDAKAMGAARRLHRFASLAAGGALFLSTQL